MIAKTFEIRDIGTFIPILAVKLEAGNANDHYLLWRAGYGQTPEDFIVLVEIGGGSGKMVCSPDEWGGRARTLPEAHRYIQTHFDRLESGMVIDVEFVLGEKPTEKLSERETARF